MKIQVRKFNDNVYIENQTYPAGVNHNGVDKYPSIGVDYIYLQWSDFIWEEQFYVDLNNHTQTLSITMIEILKDVVVNWTQDLGQEGNPNDEQKLNMIKGSIQMHIDLKAQSLGFDNINSISKYMGFDNPYRADAEALASWTANVWFYVEAELVNMQEGNRTIPTVEEAIAELPNSFTQI